MSLKTISLYSYPTKSIQNQCKYQAIHQNQHLISKIPILHLNPSPSIQFHNKLTKKFLFHHPIPQTAYSQMHLHIMITPGQNLLFPTCEVRVTDHLKSSATCSYFKCTSSSQSFMLKQIPSTSPHLQELSFQEFTNTRLIGPDAHIVPLIDQLNLSSSKVFLLEFQEFGNLKNFLKKNELNEDQALNIFKDILLAVIKVSENGIVHRDIDPRNIWIDKDYNFKLSGFERSFRVDDPRHINLKMNCLKLTHPDLRPPDIEEALDVHKIDVWGLGCLLYFLIHRASPFDQVSERVTSDRVAGILNSCLQTDPAERPSARKILEMINTQSLALLNKDFSKAQAPAKGSQYSALHSIDKLISDSTDPPDLFYLQQISFETWTRPSNTSEIFKRLANKIQTFTIPDLKILIITHRLMLSGPADILCAQLSETLEFMLKSWTNNQKNPNDSYFCEFNNGLIRQVTRNLIEKVRFHQRSKTSCNWKSQIAPGDLPEVMAYLGKIVRICEGLTMGKDILPQLNSFLAMQLVEECQRLMMCVQSLDKNNEIQAFNSRLSALTFEAPATGQVKKERFATGRVAVPCSPRSLKVANVGRSPLADSPGQVALDVNSVDLLVNEDAKDRFDVAKAQDQSQIFSKSAINFAAVVKQEPKNDFSDLINLDFSIKPPIDSTSSASSVSPVKATSIPNQVTNFSSLNLEKPSSAPQVAKNPIKSSEISMNLMFNQPAIREKQEVPKVVQNKFDPFNFNPIKTSQNRNSSVGKPEISHMSDGPTMARPSPQVANRGCSAIVQNFSPPVSLPAPKQLPSVAPRQPQARQKQVLEIDKRWIISKNDVKLGPILGQGASCTVYKGEYKRTPVAIKMMMGTYAGQNIVQEFQREVTAMISLRHPNLVLFMGASADPQMMIVSEFCRGESLFKVLHEKRQIHLSWSQKFKMILDIARGMLYLHEAQPPILHRDLKSLNLLLMDIVTGINDYIHVKVTDFGIARILDEVSARMTMQVGTCHWMAPEVINSEPYSLAADIYSFGIVLWEIAARETPYKGVMPIEIPVRVLKGDRPDLNLIGPAVPSGIKDLMRKCWDQNPKVRPTFRQIIEELEVIQGQVDF